DNTTDCGCTEGCHAGCAFFFSSRRRHTSFSRDWSSDVCSSDLERPAENCDEDSGDREPSPAPPRSFRLEIVFEIVVVPEVVLIGLGDRDWSRGRPGGLGTSMEALARGIALSLPVIVLRVMGLALRSVCLALRLRPRWNGGREYGGRSPPIRETVAPHEVGRTQVAELDELSHFQVRQGPVLLAVSGDIPLYLRISPRHRSLQPFQIIPLPA